MYARQAGCRTKRIRYATTVRLATTPNKAPYASPARWERISIIMNAMPARKAHMLQRRLPKAVRPAPPAHMPQALRRPRAHLVLPTPTRISQRVLNRVRPVPQARSPKLAPPAAAPALPVEFQYVVVAVIPAKPVSMPMPITRNASSAKRVKSPLQAARHVPHARMVRQIITIIQNVSKP